MSGRAIPTGIVAGALAILGLGATLVLHAQSGVNGVALAASPRPVTVVEARATTFRESKAYVGTLRPWVEASIGPQLVSAYVDTVLVRPGATVVRREVLATLDCRSASASSQAVAAEARAIDAEQKAALHESARLDSLLDGGFVSPNEAEQKQALSVSQGARLASQRAKLTSTSLEVDDCVLRSPFDGEIATRSADPGAFARPGAPIVSVVDRSTVRVVFDVPEDDFDAVAPGSPIAVRILATGKTIAAVIARRSPSADPDTRTVHCEADVPNTTRTLPVNTTGEIRMEVGAAREAVAVPLDAAAVTGAKATVFVVDRGVAHKATFPVEGERGGTLYLGAAHAGTLVVTEGRALLADGDAVDAKVTAFAAPAAEEAP